MSQGHLSFSSSVFCWFSPSPYFTFPDCRLLILKNKVMASIISFSISPGAHKTIKYRSALFISCCPNNNSNNKNNNDIKPYSEAHDVSF